MLPILRIIPVGGVFLAIMILVLALNPPSGPRSAAPLATVAGRGPLMQLNEHPEWRQFLILAATRRADELSRLLDLPDTPRVEGAKTAGLPATRSDAEPEDETGSIADAPGMNLQVDIGETSSTELPVRQLEEKPAAIKTPERAKSPKETRTKAIHRVRHVKRDKPQPETPFNLFDTIFGGAQTKQPTTPGVKVSQPATARTER